MADCKQIPALRSSNDNITGIGSGFIGGGGPASACGHVCNIVWGQWRNSSALAQRWFDITGDFLCTMAEETPADAMVNVQFDPVTPITKSLNVGIAPTVDSDKLAFHKPATPGTLAPAPIYKIAEIPAPTLTAQMDQILAPVKPDELDATKPGDAPILDYPEAPEAPVYVIPQPPQLRLIDLPTLPDREALVFQGERPPDDLRVPDNTFSYDEEMYSSELLDAVNAKILAALQTSSTGLSETAEDELFRRAQDREMELDLARREEITDEWAGRGFTLPGGAMMKRMDRARWEGNAKQASLSREQYIDQARRAWEYNTFIITQAIGLESQLMGYTNSMMQRIFEGERFTYQLILQTFNAQVALFSARVNAYSVDAQVFRVRLEEQLIDLQYYQGELEAQRLIGQLNQQDVNLYTAKIQAVNSLAQLYNSEVQAFSQLINAETLKLEAYRTEVSAYKTLVESKTEEYEAYRTAWQGELSKVQVYSAQVDAYQSEVNAYGTQVQAENTKSNATIQENRLLIDAFASKLETYRAELAAESERIRSEVAAYDSQIKGYSAEIDAQGNVVRLDQTRFQAEATNSYNQAQMRLREAQTNVDNMYKNAAIMQDINQAGARVAAAIGTAAYAAVATSASISGSDSSVV